MAAGVDRPCRCRWCSQGLSTPCSRPRVRASADSSRRRRSNSRRRGKGTAGEDRTVKEGNQQEKGNCRRDTGQMK
jgi:hypothetical protein